MTADLAAWLLEQIAADEKVARDVLLGDTGPGPSWRVDDLTRVVGVGVAADAPWPEEAAHIARWDPARVLAECEAKRRIMEALDYTPCPCQTANRCVIHDTSAGPPEFARERFVDPATEAVLHALALPYTDRPDYREEWKP